MVQVTINGREIDAQEGQTLLEVARQHNIHIPTLCENEAVAPYGACRLCLVEITTASGRRRNVTSCIYQVADGLSVETNTDTIRQHRAMLLELLLARCPDSDVIQAMAAEYGVKKPRFKKQTDNNKCILCANCARTCEEVVGVAAISLSRRGVERELSTPFSLDYSSACIGCGSCAVACPTGAISVNEKNGVRTVDWPHNHMEFTLKKCSVCGSYWAPEKQLEYIARISGTDLAEYDTCPDCRD